MWIEAVCCRDRLCSQISRSGGVAGSRAFHTSRDVSLLFLSQHSRSGYVATRERRAAAKSGPVTIGTHVDRGVEEGNGAPTCLL